MAVDIIARGLAASLVGSDGKISSDKMPIIKDILDTTGFTPVGNLTDPTAILGKTAEEILIMILFGIVNPTFTMPSASIQLTNSNLNHLTVGQETLIEGIIKYDRGSITPSYSPTSKYRGGPATAYSINGEALTSEAFSIKIMPVLGNNEIAFSVSYAEGDQPINSLGDPFDAPLSPGAIQDIFTLVGVYPLLDANGEEKVFNWFEDTDGSGYMSIFASESSGIKQNFAVAEGTTVTGIKQFNPLTQQWEWVGGYGAEYSLSLFNTTVMEGDPNYVLYTYNRTARVGERELRIYVDF